MADETRNIIYNVDVNTGQATSEVNQLDDSVQNLENQLMSAKQSGQRFADLLELGAGLTGGIAAFQGVVTLAGVENEKLTESLTRLMALQTTMSGLQQIANLFRTENIFLTKSLITWIKAKNVVMQKSIALRALAIAGLAALVVGIGVAIREYNKWKKSIEDTPEYENSKFGKFMTSATKAVDEFGVTLKGAWTAFATFMSGKTMEEARKAGDAEYFRLLKLQKAEKELEDFRERKKKNMEANIKRMEAEGATEKELFEKRKILLLAEAQTFKNFLVVKNGSIKESSSEEKRELFELKTARIKLENDYSNKLKEESDARKLKRAEDFEAAKEKTRTEAEEMDALMLEIRKGREEKEEEERIAKEQKQLDDAKTLNDKLIKEAERKKKLDEERDAAIALGKQKMRDLSLKSAMDSISILTNINNVAMDIQLKNAKGNAEEEERIRKFYFERNKKFQIATALMSTYQNAVSAYGSQLVPFDPSSIIRAQIAAGVAIASGLANVAVIASQSYQGGSTGSSPVQTTDAFGSTLDAGDILEAENTDPEIINGSGSGTSQRGTGETRVVVLSSDITDVAEDIKFVDTVASI